MYNTDMLLVAHIVIALSSLVMTVFAYVSPSRRKQQVSYSLVGLTLASGTALVIASNSPILSSCLTGLAYLAIVMFGIFMSQRKLASEEVNQD